MMPFEEQAFAIDCQGARMVAILAVPANPFQRGVLIVVGGPQYRAGSHRQFTLLARTLAARGIPAMRFDYRGMGDSAGEARTFESVDADIRSAIDRFFERVPGLNDVVIWGLCDAASAALFYAHRDERVGGLVLLNPWVHTEQGAARVYLRHYYLKRLFQPSLWQKIARGEFNIHSAAAAIHKFAVDAVRRTPADANSGSEASPSADAPFTTRMEEGLHRFRGRVLVILSGNDFTAQEFKDLIAASRRWRRLLENARVTRRDLPAASHTFARREWRDRVAQWTTEWVKSW